MPMQGVYFHAEVKPVSKEVVVNSHGDVTDLAALMVCTICKSKVFREAFKLTQQLLLQEGIYFETEREKKLAQSTE